MFEEDACALPPDFLNLPWCDGSRAAGRTDEAITIAHSAFDALCRARRPGADGRAGVYLVARALALVESGRFAEAQPTRGWATTAPPTTSCSTVRRGSPSSSGASACTRAGPVGRPRRFREAALIYGELNHPGVRAGATAGSAHALALDGRHRRRRGRAPPTSTPSRRPRSA